MKERTLTWMLLLMAVLLLVSAVGGIVYADFPDNFDSYGTGITSPATAGNPWTFNPDSAPCWAGTQTLAGPVNSVPAFSLPNLYAIRFVSSCDGSAHDSYLASTVNATQSYITFSIEVSVDTQPGTPSTDSIQLNVCGSPTALTVNGTVGTATSVLVSAINTHGGNKYTKLSGTEPSTIGSSCPIAFQVNAAAGNMGGFSVDFDSANVKGGNAEFSSANFIIFDQGTNAWFNISNYARSFVTVNYGNGAPVVYSTAGYNGIYSPDMTLNTLNSNSIGVNIGSILQNGVNYTGYSTQMLTPSGGCTTLAPCRIWVANPDTPVFAYAFAITDLSGNFPSNSTATITQGTHLFSSGLTDPLGYAASLVPGKYTFTLTNGAHTYSTIVNLPAITGYTQPIQILKLTVTKACGGACNIGYGAAFNSAGTSVVAVFNDSSTGTTKVSIALEKQNASGTFQISASTFTGTYGNLQDSISCNNDQCNTTLAAQLFVAFSWTGGSSGTANVPLSGGSPAGIPNIPACIWEWCVVFPNIPPLAFVCYSIIISFAAIFGAYSAKFGAVVVSILTAALTWFGWMTVPNGFITLIVALAITSFLAFMEGGR